MIVLLGMMVGCSSSEGRQAGWLALGTSLLEAEARAAVPQGIYMAPEIWVNDSSIANIDNAQMPEWAGSDFETCVHWQARYTRREMNQTRSQGEPAQWQISGVAEGWILLTEDDFFVLELTLSEEGMSQPMTLRVVSAWDGPSS